MCLFFNVSPVFCFHMYNFMFCFFSRKSGFFGLGVFLAVEILKFFTFFTLHFYKIVQMHLNYNLMTHAPILLK